MNDIAVSINADASSALREFAKIQLEQTKVLQGLQGLALAAKRGGQTQAEAYAMVSRELEAFGRKTAQVLERIQTPVDRYQKNLRELQVMHRMGKLSEEQLAAAIALEAKARDDATGATRRQMEVERQAAAITDRNKTAIDRYRESLRDLRSLRAGGQISQQTFSAERGRLRSAYENQTGVTQARNEEQTRQQRVVEEGRRVFEQTRTAQERYNGEVLRLKKLFDSKAIDSDTFKRGLGQAKNALDEAGRAGQNSGMGLMKAIGGFVGITSVIGGVSLVIRQMMNEYQNMKDRQKGAADTQLGLAEAQREALRGIGNDPTFKPEQLDKKVNEISAKTGASPRDLYNATSGAFAFAGDIDKSRAMEAVSVSAEMAPTNVAAMQANATAILSIMQKNQNLTPRQVAGFMIAAKQASPTITDQSFAQTIAPGVAQMMSFGGTEREQAALLATIGTGAGDAEGRVTQTAAIQFGKQLKTLMPEVKGGTIGRVRALQDPANKKIKAKLLGALGDEATNADTVGLTSEAKAFTTLVELVQGGGTFASDLLEKNLGRIPEAAAGQPILDESQAFINAQPIQQNERLRNQLKASTERIQIGDIKGARAAISREGYMDILKASGVGDLGQKAALASFEASTQGGKNAPVDKIINSLTARSLDMLSPTRTVSSVGVDGMSGDSYKIPRQATEEERRVGGEIVALIDELKLLRDALAENSKETKNDAEQKRRGGPPAKPGPRPSQARAR